MDLFNLFNIPIFFIVLRETLECAMILSILFGLLNKFIPSISPEEQNFVKSLRKRVWIGIGIGFFTSIVMGAIFITVFYVIEKDIWERANEIWEMIFSYISALLVTMMALSMIRIVKWKSKIESRLTVIFMNHFLNRNERGNRLPLSLLPFAIICRESLETFVLIAGIGTDGNPPSSFPIPIILGFLLGLLGGYLIYRSLKNISLYLFFTSTATLLLFMGAGFFSEACSELQELIGTKEIILWKLNCCDPSKNHGWSIAKTLFGWDNKATISSTIGYFVYWIITISYISIIYFCKVPKRRVTSTREPQQGLLPSLPQSQLRTSELTD